MQFKNFFIFVIILIMLTGCLSNVSAEEYNFENNTHFTIPKGYTLHDKSDNQVILINENTMSAVGTGILNNISMDDGLTEFNKVGFNIIDNRNVKISSVDCEEFKLKNNDGKFINLYKFNKEGINYLVGYTSYDPNFNVEVADNPVNIIVTSLSK
ncbi:MAG: hypothetical protein IJJ47_08495 [Methanosphaera sp.]|nr:hypothetical protein [Methanosphaera sp.]